MPHGARHTQRPLVGSPPLADVAEFLAAHTPFDQVDQSELERVVASIEVEFHPAGATIFAPGDGPVKDMRVIRHGAVELVLDGRMLDLLESGELVGEASMLSGLPPGFTARAAQDTLCYLVPAALATDLLARPAGMRDVARSLLTAGMQAVGAVTPTSFVVDQQPVSALLRHHPVICPPETSIREAAQMMSDAAQTALVVELGSGKLGILTDRDLRTRVLARGVSADLPVSAAMTTPVYTSGPERAAGDVLLDMLERNVHHCPVIAGSGEILGVISDSDLVAADAHSSFHLRRAIANASTSEQVIAAARQLAPMVIALHDAGLAATSITGVHTIVLDAITRRLVELATSAWDEQAPQFAWLALGSHARGETTPGSDMDNAIVWSGESDEEHTRRALCEIGAKVTEQLEQCGLRRDSQGVSADNELVVRSAESWRRAATSWIEHPTQEQALILVSVFVDNRPVWSRGTGTQLADAFTTARHSQLLLRLLGRFALSYRPPTGFMRGLVVEHSGEHLGQLDLKRGGLVPIVGLARWAGIAAGVTTLSTRDRLRGAGEAGTLSTSDVQTLEDAFELLTELRLAHQIEQLRAGSLPDDHIDPRSLSDLTRRHLKTAFRAVGAVQQRLSTELSLGAR